LAKREQEVAEMLRVRVRYEDEESRTALKKAGFRWNPQRKLWEGPDTPANRELLDRLGLLPEALLAPAADHELERQAKQAADLLGEYIYSFSREGRRVVGISWAGAKRLAQKYLPPMSTPKRPSPTGAQRPTGAAPLSLTGIQAHSILSSAVMDYADHREFNGKIWDKRPGPAAASRRTWPPDRPSYPSGAE
jgi:hypothetical protein